MMDPGWHRQCCIILFLFDFLDYSIVPRYVNPCCLLFKYIFFKYIFKYIFFKDVARESPLYLLAKNNLNQMNLEDYGPDGI